MKIKRETGAFKDESPGYAIALLRFWKSELP